MSELGWESSGGVAWLARWKCKPGDPPFELAACDPWPSQAHSPARLSVEDLRRLRTAIDAALGAEQATTALDGPWVAWEGAISDSPTAERYRVVCRSHGGIKQETILETARSRDAMGRPVWSKVSIQPFDHAAAVGWVLGCMAERRSAWDEAGALLERLGQVSGGKLAVHKPTIRVEWYEHDGIARAELHDGHTLADHPVLESVEVLRPRAADAVLGALHDLLRKWEAS